MTVAFVRPSVEVAAGETAHIDYTVTNDGAAPTRFEVRVEPGDEQLPLSWLEVDPPGRVGAGGQAYGRVWVRVPPGTRPQPGRHGLRVVAVQPRSRHRSADECTVIVTEADDEPAPCAWFPEPPSLQLDEGGITATVRLANCGKADLDLRLRFRHEDGWVFRTEGEVTLGIDAGPVEVTVRLDLGDREVHPEDRIRVDAEWQGQVLTWSEAAVAAAVPPPPRGLRRALAVGAVAGAVALLWMLGGGLDADEAVDLGPASADEQESEDDLSPIEPGISSDGAGVDPGELDVDPGDLDFGLVFPGRSATTSVQVFNTGGLDLVVADVFLEDGGAAFDIRGDECSGTPLVPGDSCAVEVTFAPTDPGFYETVLEILDEDGEAVTVVLTGEGVADDPPEVEVILPEPGRYNAGEEDDEGAYVDLTLYAEVHDDHDGAIEDVRWSAGWDSESDHGTEQLGTGNDFEQRFYMRAACGTTYTVTAAVTDSAGQTAEDSVMLTLWRLC